MREATTYTEGNVDPDYKLGWDDPLPEEMQKAWKDAICDIVTAPEIKFKRATRPENAKGRPEAIGFWDGSLVAFDANIYICWQLDTSYPSWHVALLCSKSRIAPL